MRGALGAAAVGAVVFVLTVGLLRSDLDAGLFGALVGAGYYLAAHRAVFRR